MVDHLSPIQDLIDVVKSAVTDFINEDPNLLILEAHEQAISHRIAVHLEKRIDNRELHVDCEYNKNIGETKRMKFGHIDEGEQNTCGCRICSNEALQIEKDRAFRPDIIVHRRTFNTPTNTIAIEIKKGEFCPFDEAKLKAMTSTEQDFTYTLGAFIYFKNNQPEFRWYSLEDELQISPAGIVLQK